MARLLTKLRCYVFDKIFLLSPWRDETEQTGSLDCAQYGLRHHTSYYIDNIVSDCSAAKTRRQLIHVRELSADIQSNLTIHVITGGNLDVGKCQDVTLCLFMIICTVTMSLFVY